MSDDVKPPMDGTLTVGCGSGMGGFTASVSLATGEGDLLSHGSPTGRWVEFYRNHRRRAQLVVPEADLPALREFAARMRDQGPYTYRDQFAQAGVGFTFDEGDDSIAWEYHIDGGLPRDADKVFDIVAKAVSVAMEAQLAEEQAAGPVLPDVKDDAELMPLHRETSPWLPATHRVASLHRLKSETWTRAGDGSHIVMLGEQSVLKFYVPHWPDTVDDEEDVLQLLRYEDLPVAIPKVQARGELDGWQYLAVSRVEGTALRDIELRNEDALEVARAIGRAIRALHDIEVPKDSRLRRVVPKWRPFLSANREHRREHELKRGTPEVWADRLVDYLRSWRYRKRPTGTLLHADLTHEHIMLRQVDGRWELSGFIDFGDVKVGDPAYDFAAPFAFWTADRPDLRRAMLEGYGAGEELIERIFESLLLHEYGALGALDLDGLETIEDVRRRYVELDG